MDANRTFPQYELTSKLARHSLESAMPPDRDRQLAWVNSVCILFILIGVLGYERGSATIKPLPGIEDPVPAVVETLPPPPPQASEEQSQEKSEQDRPDAPQVVAVTLDAPTINFSVPTMGNLLVPSALATAPPAAPLKPVAPLHDVPRNINSTGNSGERPQPPYPKIALAQGLQGSVTLSLTVDDSGAITDIEVKSSSGVPLLDRSALDFVKHHWVVPPGEGVHTCLATIHYRLKQD